ncbi:MAG: cyclase family protein [Chloroflexota bacterium]|nr:MAG: cyclase family protein [Chloroflexota bacterium]
MPVWPGDPEIALELTSSLDAGDPYNLSHLSCGVHTGTHVDAPLHFIAGGGSVDQMPLEVLVGPAQVVHLLDVDAVTPYDLEQANLPPGTCRLLLRTRNSELWRRGVSAFTTDFVALTQDAAAWIVARGIQLIGMDYLSVQRYSDAAPLTHRILLKAGVVIVEGLDLGKVPAGTFNLVCLPLPLVGAEGAPARAILLEQA